MNSTDRSSAYTRRRRLISIAGLSCLLGAFAAWSVTTADPDRPGAASAAGAHGGKATVITTPEGTVIARQVDARRGVTFEIQTTADYGTSALYVTLAASAPKTTRELLLTRPLAATCTVPGHRVREFAGRWDRRFRQFGTALLIDASNVIVARAATRCALWIGDDGGYFDGAPFSRVRLR